MANHLAIHSLTQSLKELLRQSHAAAGNAVPAATFEVVSSAHFTTGTLSSDAEAVVTLYLYRVAVNHQLRNVGARPPIGALGLDLHYIVTVFADDADVEQKLLGWTLRELHYTGVLPHGLLTADAAWDPDELITLIPAELSYEDTVRIWDAADRPYRLSYGFIARVVRLAKDAVPDGRPVVATRFEHRNDVPQGAT
jgi:hypothetical protein